MTADVTPGAAAPGVEATLVEALAAALAGAARFNPDDAVRPAAVLWTDPAAQWQPVVPHLRRFAPHLLALGEYAPEQRTGPSIWLRCVIERTLDAPRIPAEATPILYLPGVSRQQLGAAQTCPRRLQPLVELQYRGVCWTQKNGRDWTVEAFLTSRAGGLGLDVARDAATRQAMLRAVAELALAPLPALRGRRLDAQDFDGLLSDDPIKDLLSWLGDPQAIMTGWEAARRDAFAARCRADFDFDPAGDGELVAAERLGRRDGPWQAVWNRFAEAPARYPGVPALLRRARPDDLFAERSSWPQENEADEAALRRRLAACAGRSPAAARAELLALEQEHGQRRGWVWAALGQAPLAYALEHVALIAARTAEQLGGASVAELARGYAAGAWQVDAAALAAMGAVKSAADRKAVSAALQAVYLPWLEAAARRLQALAEQEPRALRDPPERYAARDQPGTAILFADGLRFDVAQRLAARLRADGRTVRVETRWAALPTVTATAKPAVAPVAEQIAGASPGEEFRPAGADDGRPLTAARFRKLLDAAGYRYLAADETGDPAGRAWTEHGHLDRLGHSLQAGLAAGLDDQLGLLRERAGALLDAGWREVRVVTDHGWLWLPGGLPKVDLPRYLTATRWARCAAIAGDSAVETPVVAWHWNAGERIAVPPGVACFTAGCEYAHGGVSLQESLIPVLRVAAGAGAAPAPTAITALSWVGLRCRVRIAAPPPGAAVDLRTRVADAAASIDRARPVDARGAASLLVADDELEGASAVVVVLDAGGRVVARQSTIVGGGD